MYFITSPVARVFQSVSYLARVFLVRYSLYELNKTGDRQHPCLSALQNTHLLCLLGLAILCHPDQWTFSWPVSPSRQSKILFYLFIPPPCHNNNYWARASSLSRLHDHTQTHSVELLWTSDQPEAETSTWQHITLIRDRHPCPRRVSNPKSQHASGRRTTP